MNFAEVFGHIAQVLDRHEVDYIVVGGSAVWLHGYYRPTTKPDGRPTNKVDFDLWYNPNIGTFYDILRALDDLGHDTARVRAIELINPKKSYLKYESDTYTLDFLPVLDPIEDYKAARNRAALRQVAGVDVYLLSYEDLVRAKAKTNRPKDQQDIAALRQLHEGGNEG